MVEDQEDMNGDDKQAVESRERFGRGDAKAGWNVPRPAQLLASGFGRLTAAEIE